VFKKKGNRGGGISSGERGKEEGSRGNEKNSSAAREKGKEDRLTIWGGQNRQSIPKGGGEGVRRGLRDVSSRERKKMCLWVSINSI